MDPNSDPAAWQREMLKTPALRQAFTDFDRSRFIFLVRSARVAEEVSRGTMAMDRLAAGRDQQRAACGAALAFGARDATGKNR